MRNKEKSISRLRRLARHLRAGRLSKDYSSMDVFSFEYATSLICFESKFYTFAPFVIEEMPEVFPIDWGRNCVGKVVNYRSPNENLHYAVTEYFGLTVEEAKHCFQVKSQFPELYRGRHISPKTMNTKSVVRNINGLIKTAIRQDLYERKIIYRQVLIEKCTRISISDWLKTQNSSR